MKLIKLTQGMSAMVDDDLFEELNKTKWYAFRNNGGNFYARTGITVGGKHKNVSMHRYILGVTNPKIDVDHRDMNGLNNTRENIRQCTRSQNSTNKLPIKHSSIYKGVFASTGTGKFRARITVNKRPISLGTFANEIDAAKRYDSFASDIFGEFACLNLPNQN